MNNYPYNMTKKDDNLQVLELKCKSAFELLSDKEKMYAYYLYKASWEGAKICLYQCSLESPYLFDIFQNIFSKTTPDKIESKEKKKRRLLKQSLKSKVN